MYRYVGKIRERQHACVIVHMYTVSITVNWTIPSSDNYVTYYTISYTPSCPQLSSGNETVSVAPHQQSTTTYSKKGTKP
uniref:Fibronectin type-III domain-containing protein n=1 Tax=Amphimedon queenslandica TaxID=400682 RepID=A0A1X7UI02_AMPQE